MSIASARKVSAARPATKKVAPKAKQQPKEMLSESTEITGDRETKQPQVGLDNILDIRKLAGLK